VPAGLCSMRAMRMLGEGIWLGGWMHGAGMEGLMETGEGGR